MNASRNTTKVRTVVGIGCLLLSSLFSNAQARDDDTPIRHVLLISVDGFHEQDLANCIGGNTCPNIALLAKSGLTYTNAHTPGLSDSFPGLAALLTGGSPRSAGLFYDVSYDRTLYSPSDTQCKGTQGWNVVFDETTGYDGYQGGALTHLDGGGKFNPDAIPHRKLANGSCVAVYPHNYIKTNTIFEVVHENIHGARTAWADKHAWGYDWVNGPSGVGVDDLARTEINSIDPATGTYYLDTYEHTEKFDNIHVQIILNQIDGKDSTGKPATVPTLFGTNFQTLSVAQKATVASGGGYYDASFTPGKEVAAAIGYVDTSIGKMVSELKQKNLYSSTLIIVTAKHGQSPTDHTKLVKNGDTLTKLLEANNYLDSQGNFGQNATTTGNLNDGSGLSGTGMVQTDDVGLIWLRDQSQVNQVVATLKANLSCNAPGICANGPYAYILHGAAEAAFFGDPAQGRTPDIIVQPNPGVIYTSSTSKDEEHGGNAPDDSHLALLVSSAQIRHGRTVAFPVLTTQVAPTIIDSLGLQPWLLQSVREEGTQPLPGFGRFGRFGDLD